MSAKESKDFEVKCYKDMLEKLDNESLKKRFG